MLHSISCDLIETSKSECQTLIRHFETENVISVYNTLYDGAVHRLSAVQVALSRLSRGQPIDNEIVPIHR